MPRAARPPASRAWEGAGQSPPRSGPARPPGLGPLPHPPERERAAAAPLPSARGAGSDARPLPQRAHCGRRARRRRRQRAGTHGVAPTCPRPAPLPHAGGAPPCTRARAAALGRVRGVRWRWGRREPELSQAPRPPERAKWGVMAAGGSGCTSSAGSGGCGVSPRRTGRCVRICVWRARAAGRPGWEAGRGVTLVPSAEPRRPATGALPRAAGAWTGVGGAREGPGGELHLSHCVFCLFFSPKVPFPSVRRPAGP